MKSVELGQSKVPDGLRIYAVGDVHGCVVELQTLHAMIERDIEAHPDHDYRIVFLGDYQDRGPDSKDALIYLMCLAARDEKVICLRGNHDTALIDFLDDPIEHGPLFFRNGGADTLRAYGLRLIGDRPEDDAFELVHGFGIALINGHHLAFLKGLATSCTFGDYFFCHAGIRPGVALDAQSDEDLMWIRHDFLDHRQPFEKVIVHGHTSGKAVDEQNNRINIDTRCHATGLLTCLVLEGDGHRYLQTEPR